MDLVYIYGPPAAGKFTVGSELARLTGYALFHNHLSIDCALPLFEFGSDAFWRLVHQIRIDTIEAAARAGRSLIFTNVYAHPEDLPNALARFEAVEAYGGRICLVQLTSPPVVLASRVVDTKRSAMGKIATTEALQELLGRFDVYTTLPGRDSLVIDNATLTAEAVARQIVEHYDLALT